MAAHIGIVHVRATTRDRPYDGNTKERARNNFSIKSPHPTPGGREGVGAR
jgi:hypothetical protein